MVLTRVDYEFKYGGEYGIWMEVVGNAAAKETTRDPRWRWRRRWVAGEVAGAVEVDRRQMGAAGGRLRPAGWAAGRETGRSRAAENTCRPSVTTQTDET